MGNAQKNGKFTFYEFSKKKKKKKGIGFSPLGFSPPRLWSFNRNFDLSKKLAAITAFFTSLPCMTPYPWFYAFFHFFPKKIDFFIKKFDAYIRKVHHYLMLFLTFLSRGVEFFKF